MGLSGVKEDWRPFVGELAKQQRAVLVYDRRDIGESRVVKKSNEENEDVTIDVEARDCLALLEFLGSDWQSVHILGWSMGGHILQAMLVLPDAKEHKDGGVSIGKVHVRSAILAATLTKLPRGEFRPEVLEEA